MSKRKSYQELTIELEGILTQLQSGELDIDAAMKAYQKGLELIGELEQYLKTAENTIRKVSAQPKSSAGKKS
jgi:exodeoxyribonuclease VII small subunit